MEQSLQQKFIEKLESHFGQWDKNIARFGSTPYGKISEDLCMSSSQFTKLIYGSATEGMYVRSIRNIDRLVNLKNYQLQIEELQKFGLRSESDGSGVELQPRNKLFYYLPALIIGILIGVLGMNAWKSYLETANATEILKSHHPLDTYFSQEFGSDFDSPYLSEADVQTYCPCSAFEGEWALAEPFKLPIPGIRQPGLYYIAKQSDLRMKCTTMKTGSIQQGKLMSGYEYLISEIWLDMEHEPLIPKYFDNEKKVFTKQFVDLNFEEQASFKKIATLHAFNVNRFEFRGDSIIRKAELTGRFAKDSDFEMMEKYEIDLNHILNNILGNLTKTNCQSILNPFCDPNDLKAHESTIYFDCMYTIDAENLGIGGGYPYIKGFRLEEQSYADNLICDCTE
jgi:hypothetical protein